MSLYGIRMSQTTWINSITVTPMERFVLNLSCRDFTTDLPPALFNQVEDVIRELLMKSYSFKPSQGAGILEAKHAKLGDNPTRREYPNQPLHVNCIEYP